MKSLSRIQYPFVCNLSLHPLNEKIYGREKPDAELIDSIQKIGVRVPLIVDKDRRVLSGSRRLLAARETDPKGQGQLPVMYFQGSELEAEQLIIHANRQRAKTRKQVRQEIAELTRIEAALASDRMKSGRPVRKSAQGRAVDLVAKKIGRGKEFVQQAAEITKAAASGDSKAQAVVSKYDAGEISMNAAHKEISNRERLRRDFKDAHPEITKGKSNSQIHRMIRDEQKRRPSPSTPESIAKGYEYECNIFNSIHGSSVRIVPAVGGFEMIQHFTEKELLSTLKNIKEYQALLDSKLEGDGMLHTPTCAANYFCRSMYRHQCCRNSVRFFSLRSPKPPTRPMPQKKDFKTTNKFVIAIREYWGERWPYETEEDVVLTIGDLHKLDEQIEMEAAVSE